MSHILCMLNTACSSSMHNVFLGVSLCWPDGFLVLFYDTSLLSDLKVQHNASCCVSIFVVEHACQLPYRDSALAQARVYMFFVHY